LDKRIYGVRPFDEFRMKTHEYLMEVAGHEGMARAFRFWFECFRYRESWTDYGFNIDQEETPFTPIYTAFLLSYELE